MAECLCDADGGGSGDIGTSIGDGGGDSDAATDDAGVSSSDAGAGGGSDAATGDAGTSSGDAGAGGGSDADAGTASTASALLIVSGDLQIGPVGQELTQPVVVRVVDPKGLPVAGQSIDFQVAKGGGSAGATSPSDANGEARGHWTLGTVPGANVLEARLLGLPPVTFFATAVAGPPAAIAKVAGDVQIAAPGGPVKVAPEVLVTDQFGNPVPNIVVGFVVTEGGGSVWRPAAITDVAGKASCEQWVLGMTKGRNALSAEANALPPAEFSAAVTADVLLDLGHASAVTLLRLQKDRLLSGDTADHSGRWVLRDRATSAPIASGGDFACSRSPSNDCDPNFADLAGPTVLVGFQSGFEIRSSSDGHVLSRVLGAHSWRKLASDGSFVCAGTPTALSAWAPDGRLLFSRAGDYRWADTSAEPSAIRVARGPSGHSVIETIDPSSGASSTAPFDGQFHSWFTDGQRFLTTLANVAWVYSSAGQKEATLSLPTTANLTGQGSWVWTFSGYPERTLTIYAANGGGAPVAAYTMSSLSRAIPSGTTIGVLHWSAGISVIDLSGSVPSRTDYTLPFKPPDAYVASSAAEWLVGFRGALFDGLGLGGPFRTIGSGSAFSLAGGGNRIAVATASGKTLYFNASTNTLEGEIAFPSSKVELSLDGTVLAAAAGLDDVLPAERDVSLFSLPSGTKIRGWNFPAGSSPTPIGFSLSASGTHIANVLSGCSIEVWPATLGSATWSGSTPSCQRLSLSPSGNRFAFTAGTSLPSTTTHIYQDGALVTAVPRQLLGWLDNGTLLVSKYEYVGSVGGMTSYAGAEIRDATGTVVATPPLPELRDFQPVTATMVYSPSHNALFSLDTGATVWSGLRQSGSVALAQRGAVAGDRVVYQLGSRILSEPY